MWTNVKLILVLILLEHNPFSLLPYRPVYLYLQVLDHLSLSHFFNQIFFLSPFPFYTFVIMQQNHWSSSFSYQKCPSTFACFCDGSFFMSKCSLNYSSHFPTLPSNIKKVIFGKSSSHLTKAFKLLFYTLKIVGLKSCLYISVMFAIFEAIFRLCTTKKPNESGMNWPMCGTLLRWIRKNSIYCLCRLLCINPYKLIKLYFDNFCIACIYMKQATCGFLNNIRTCRTMLPSDLVSQ